MCVDKHWLKAPSSASGLCYTDIISPDKEIRRDLERSGTFPSFLLPDNWMLWLRVEELEQSAQRCASVYRALLGCVCGPDWDVKTGSQCGLLGLRFTGENYEW